MNNADSLNPNDTQRPDGPPDRLHAESSPTRIAVSAVIQFSAEVAYGLVSDPTRHHLMDGSGMVQPSPDAAPIRAVGDVFTMEMNNERRGDYKTDNHVSALEPGRKIVWKTSRYGQDPVGHWWAWEFEPLGPSETRVTHTYDWADVTDPEVIRDRGYPRVSADELADSLRGLARSLEAAGQVPDDKQD